MHFYPQFDTLETRRGLERVGQLLAKSRNQISHVENRVRSGYEITIGQVLPVSSVTLPEVITEEQKKTRPSFFLVSKVAN